MPHSEDPILEYTSDYKFLDNRDGKVCSTYAEKFVVPSRMPFDSLIRCSKFRSRCRMPALTFVYNYDANKYSSLYRSSQSKVGMQNSRSPDD
jgi:myotubularin-related protein 1/2